MLLKPRQQQAYDAVFTALNQGIGRQLVALPTGVGKTILACEIAKKFKKTLFLAHRMELISQTANAMSRVAPELPQGFIVQGAHNTEATFTVGMIQTVFNRLNRINPKEFDLVVIDEAHHSCAKTYRTVADHFEPRLRLGLSATPERSDGAPLSNLFDAITYSMNLGDAINEGYLVPPKCIQVTTKTSLDRVRCTAGDFNQGDLERTLNTPARNRLIVDAYRKHGGERRTVCFTAGVQHAKDVAASFQKAGIAGEWISGDDPNREEKLSRFRAGEIRVLANAMLLTEGWDDPATSCVIMARPTKSRGLYAQCVGRGLRLAEGKTDCLLLDLVDSASRHNLLSAWRFFGQEGIEVPGRPRNKRAEQARDKAKNEFGMEPDLMVIERLLDILKPPPRIEDFSYGSNEWHYSAATEKQVEMLKGYGFDVLTSDWTRGQASAVIGNLPASHKQVSLLLAMGYDVLSRDWTRQQATVALERAKASGVTPDWNRLRPKRAVTC
jgi:superfamily II DNA or RNA helicase